MARMAVLSASEGVQHIDAGTLIQTPGLAAGQTWKRWALALKPKYKRRLPSRQHLTMIIRDIGGPKDALAAAELVHESTRQDSICRP